MSHLHAPSLNVQNSELQIEFVFVCLRDIFNNEFSSSTKFERFENFLLKKTFQQFSTTVISLRYVGSSNLECSTFGTLNDPEANMNRKWSELKLTKQT